MNFSLIVPAFIAGILTFLAPCTLPLAPAYIGFISGASAKDLKDPGAAKSARRKIFLNGLLFVIGFSAVFIFFGTVAGLFGHILFGYRMWLSRIGGIFVILFGLFMLNVLKFPLLSKEMRIRIRAPFRKGNLVGSFALGATFGFGWTPCIGPILGSILMLAAASATLLEGAFLLGIFSLGLAVPFLIIAAGFGSASARIAKLGALLNIISIGGGLFLVFLGTLLLTNMLGLWTAYFYRWFSFIHYERLLDYL